VLNDEYVCVNYWVDPSELVHLRDCDVIWDEVATHLDATQWQNVPLTIKRWLQQHRKYGVEIYGNTQDFAMIDISMRRLVSDLLYSKKLFGTGDPSPTRPEVKNPWAVTIRYPLDPQNYSEDKKNPLSFFDINFIYISKKLISVFDTRQEIKMGQYPALNHIERKCDDCGHVHVRHA